MGYPFLDEQEKSPSPVIKIEDVKKDERGCLSIQKKEIDFPYDVIDGVAGEYAHLLSEYTEAPQQFPYMTFLTCLGSLLAQTLSLKTMLRPQSRYYVLLLGPSGRSRKSTTIKHTIGFFKDTLTYDFQLNVCWGVGSDMGLLKMLKKYGSLLLTLDEFKQFCSKSGIKASSLLSCVATLFDGNNYENHTKNDSITIENGYLSMMAASTPETFEATWESSFTDIGMNNRIFIVPGEGVRHPNLPPELPPEKIHALQKKIGEILNLVGNGLIMKMTGKAQKIYDDWYENLESSIYSQRLETYCLRFMPLLAINELKTEIDTDTVLKAIRLCDWQLDVRKLYVPIDADTKTAVMEEKIRRQLTSKGPMKARELKQFTNAHRAGLFIFDQAINNLKRAGELKIDEASNDYAIIL